MTSLLRGILPVSTSMNRDVDGDEYNVEYSFAMEYDGPPVSYNIPQAAPVDLGRIPTAYVVAMESIGPPVPYDIPQVVPVNVGRIPIASAVSASSMSSNLSLPFVQSSVKSDSLNKKLSNKEVLGSARVSGSRSGELAGSGALGLIRDDEDLPQLSNGNGSSGTLGFSDSCDVSRELSGSLEVANSNRDLDESGSSSSASEPEDFIDEAPSHDNRTQLVTFGGPESHDIVYEESDLDEQEIMIQERRHANSLVKKGLCYRCLKGTRFTEKEVCIVCNAKYCRDCVLRVMGSMPEGRKCIPCIGFRIDESKRGNLGKCSRMLKRLLTDWEVKQRMLFEVSSQANQLPPWLVIVNDRPISVEELVQLQSCVNPPKRLKPGKYWYDKVSGLWGKEGHKPSQIISPQLAVGGPILRNASNGNTNIMINNREITKAELWMLQMARINCDGYPHFWVSADGSYQEEGQNQVRGKIWEKTGINLVCAVLSLPTPSQSTSSLEEEVDNNGDNGQNEEKRSLTKLLMVGHDQSGTSTIFKQAKILYDSPFSEDERRNVKFMIQSNMYNYLGILLEGRKRFEEEFLIEMRRKQIDQPSTSGHSESDQVDEQNIYAISPKLKAFSDWLLQVMMSGNLEAIFPAATREYAPLVEELWKDKAFQATYSRRNELYLLPRDANYFLHRAAEISRTDYEPSDMDILYADGITFSNGLSCMEFSFPKPAQESFMESADQHDPVLRYQLIRAHPSCLGENCKWLEMFEDVNLVLYCIDLSSYDQFYEDSNGVIANKMLESKRLFESIVTHGNFQEKEFVLVLNKFDLLEEKIERVPLTRCDWFHDFNPVISRHQSSRPHPHGYNGNNNGALAQCAYHYIAQKFKRLFDSLTGRKLYVSPPVTGLEGDSVGALLKYGREILKWVEEDKPSVSVNEWSSESVETSC